MASRFNFPFFQSFTASTGAVGAGWKLYFWQAGTTSTAQTTYSDAALQTANANPVVADANGRWPDIFLQDALYNVELKDENDVLLDSADNVGSLLSTTSAAQTEAQTAVSDGQSVFTLSTITYSSGNLSVYRNGAFIRGFSETTNSSITLNATDALAVKTGDEFVFVADARAGNTTSQLTVLDSVTASATQTQAGATALTKQLNRITTCATTSDAVKLPTATEGLYVIVRNDGANAVAVWPNTSDAIDGGAVDAVDSNTLAAGAARTYTALDSTNWVTTANT